MTINVDDIKTEIRQAKNQIYAGGDRNKVRRTDP